MSSTNGNGGGNSGAIILKARDVKKSFPMGGGHLDVLKGINLSVLENETIALVGPSGAGKSTFLQILGGLDKPTSGTIQFRDRVLSEMKERELAKLRNARIGFVFQFYHLLKELTALENVLLPAMIKRGYLSRRKVAISRAQSLMEEVSLQDRMDHYPQQLSGGEQQRVAIARALMNEPDIMMCDEPTGNLDQDTGQQILDVLWAVKETRPVAFVIVTHDERLADQADRKLTIIDGKITDG